MPTLSTGQTRAASVVVYTAFGIGTVMSLVTEAAAGFAGTTSAVLRAVGVIGCIALFLFTRQSRQVHAPTRQIDERERADRASSYQLSFQILITACFALFILVLASHALGGPNPPGTALGDLLAFIAVGGFALPSVVLAWQDDADLDDVEVGA
jgi:Na+/melibiose symporter-like transporter